MSTKLLPRSLRQQDSGLPVVDSLSLWLYESTGAFAYWGRGQSETHEVADISAFTTGRRIHVNLEKMRGRSWGTVVDMMAHEYGHVLHNQLADYDVKAVIWFKEGFAEWVQSKVLHSLMWRNIELTRRRASRELEYHGEFRLSRLEDRTGWKVHGREPGGWVKTYVLAFMGVDQLIRDKGFSAAIQYFQTGEFDASFGQSQEALEAIIEKSIRQIPRSDALQFVVPRPDWRVGFQWRYQVKQSDKISTVEDMKIVGKGSTAQEPVFMIRMGNEDRSYDVETLGLLESKKGGVVTSRRDKPSQILTWPLHSGKKWNNEYTVENFETKRTTTVHLRMVVPGIEKVKVPAGTFKAIKIEAYDFKSGRLVAEYWYSPESRWFVKTLVYSAPDSYYREQQLVSFQVES
jgi:hypothetical protein